jgi:hypothetical protein
VDRTVAGRGIKGRQLSADEVDEVRAEMANYQRFAEVSEQIVVPTGSAGDGAPSTGDGKGALRAAFERLLRNTESRTATS